MATRALSALEARSQPAVPPSVLGPLQTAAVKPMAPANTDGPRRFPELSARAWVLVAVIGLHIAVFALVLTQRYVASKPQAPVVVQLLSIQEAPPPVEAPKIVMETPPVVIPPPVFEIEDRPQAIKAVVAENPSPPQVAAPAAAVVAERLPSEVAVQAPSAVSGGDLSASMIEAVPPKYPYESRRLKEQGTVVLDVQLTPAGLVERIAVRQSSGFPRLDKAALEAVRRWRWSPTLRGGQPVAVRGVVEIPFALTARK